MITTYTMLPVQTLAGLGDLNDFCDVVDSLEEQGIEKIMDVSVFDQEKQLQSCSFEN